MKKKYGLNITSVQPEGSETGSQDKKKEPQKVVPKSQYFKVYFKCF